MYYIENKTRAKTSLHEKKLKLQAYKENRFGVVNNIAVISITKDNLKSKPTKIKVKQRKGLVRPLGRHLTLR